MNLVSCREIALLSLKSVALFTLPIYIIIKYCFYRVKYVMLVVYTGLQCRLWLKRWYHAVIPQNYALHTCTEKNAQKKLPQLGYLGPVGFKGINRRVHWAWLTLFFAACKKNFLALSISVNALLLSRKTDVWVLCSFQKIKIVTYCLLFRNEHLAFWCEFSGYSCYYSCTALTDTSCIIGCPNSEVWGKSWSGNF